VTCRRKWETAWGRSGGRRAVGNGVRFDGLTFDERYGGEPGFLPGLEQLGRLYACAVPGHLPGFPPGPNATPSNRGLSSSRPSSDTTRPETTPPGNAARQSRQGHSPKRQ
jgi:hypothetical protein